MKKVIIWFFANPENIYAPISSVNFYDLSEGKDFEDYIDKWMLDHPFDTNAIAYKRHRIVITSYKAVLENSWTWIPDDADWDEYEIKEEDE